MKSTLNISCPECETYLVAYMEGDVSPLLRRRIARHLDHCLSCYGHYIQELNLIHNLSREVRLIGDANQPNYDQLWGAIQSEIQQPKPLLTSFPLRYRLALLVLALSFLAPMTLGGQNLPSETPPTQPSPIVPRVTPRSSNALLVTRTTVAYLTDDVQATPEAPQHAIGPSVKDVVNNTPDFRGHS